MNKVSFNQLDTVIANHKKESFDKNYGTDECPVVVTIMPELSFTDECRMVDDIAEMSLVTAKDGDTGKESIIDSQDYAEAYGLLTYCTNIKTDGIKPDRLWAFVMASGILDDIKMALGWDRVNNIDGRITRTIDARFNPVRSMCNKIEEVLSIIEQSNTVTPEQMDEITQKVTEASNHVSAIVNNSLKSK